MNKQEALNIIKQEGLHGYNFEGKNIGADEVGIQFCDNRWKVFSTDEKATYRVIKEYNSEDEAINHVIECLRINKRFEERRNRKKDSIIINSNILRILEFIWII